MDERTLTALQASIKHWEENVAAEVVGDVKLGPSDCALCRLFWNKLHAPIMPENDGDAICVRCDGCPVLAATGQHGCNGSPYGDAEDAFMEWDDVEQEDSLARFHEAAQAELDFLKSLLPAQP
jgi:hypothetical protein